MRNSALLFIATVLSIGAKAGSLLGADIQYAHVEGLTWSFTVTAYVDPLAFADSPELYVETGGAVDTIPRESQTLIVADCFDQLYVDVYTWEHTFSGPGVFEVRAWKGTRAEVMNMSTVPDNVLCLSTDVFVSAEMTNSSPVFGAPQRTSYYTANQFVHDPLVTDTDGDSLAFYLSPPQGSACSALTDYTEPALVTPEGDFTMLDPATGIFQWVYPNTSGEFVVVIHCTEFRDGTAIGSVTRDMTVCLEAPFTNLEEKGRNDPAILQTTLDGPITVRMNECLDCLIDILDTRGGLVQHVRPTGPSTLIATEAMVPGIYLVKVIDERGAVTSGRITIAH